MVLRASFLLFLCLCQQRLIKGEIEIFIDRLVVCDGLCVQSVQVCSVCATCAVCAVCCVCCVLCVLCAVCAVCAVCCVCCLSYL